MEGNKISFSFSNVKKKQNLLINKKPDTDKSNVELIKCVEGKEIKLIVEKEEEAPLVIPVKGNTHTSAALASLNTRRKVLLGEEEPPIENPVPTTETQTTTVDDVPNDLEKRAEREILSEISSNNYEAGNDNNFVVPVVKPDDLPLDGAKESTLDDYESIPIEKFGMAMLRGMGWVEPPQKETPLMDNILPRPKGMGLGADKALKPKPLLIPPESNEVLEIKRLAFVRILGGKFKDYYGQIQGFDDHAGRVIVKMAIGGGIEVFNEFMCQPVSKKEYAEYGKCINTAKYEEYKRRENEHGQILPEEKVKIKKEEDIKKDKKKEYDHKEYKYKDDKYRDDYFSKDHKKVNVEKKYKNEKLEDLDEHYKKRSDKSSRHISDDYESSKSISKYPKNMDSEDDDKTSKHTRSRSKSRKRRDSEDECYNNRPSSSKSHHSSKHRKRIDSEEEDYKYRYRSRSRDYGDSRTQSSSKHHRKQDQYETRKPEAKYSNSSDSSDNDSSIERRHKKKSSKSKSKKSKKSKKKSKK